MACSIVCHEGAWRVSTKNKKLVLSTRIFGVLRDAASHGCLAHHLLFIQLAIEFRPHHVAVRVLVRRDILQRLFLFDVNYCVIQRIIKNDVCCFSREEYRS